MKLKTTITLILTFLIFNCAPSVERYKNKARKALQNEDSQLAREYLQKAFESSLDGDFFPLGRWNSYNNVFESASRNKLVLIENQASRLKSYFTVYDIAKNDDWKRRVKGYINSVSLSPGGQYAILHVSNPANSCYFEIWDLSSKDMVNFDKPVACGQTAGISDQGLVIYVSPDRTISSYDLNSSKLIEKYAELPKSPNKNIPAIAAFQFSPENDLFMTFGSFGLYYLYSLKDQQLKLITKDSSSAKIYFLPRGNDPGVIVGGASDHHVVFYSSSSYSPLGSYPVRYWQDAVFIKKDTYYYIEDNRLVQVIDNKETKLPIWGVRVFADAGGQAFLLSPLGHLISYDKIDPNEESQAIFQMGWEIK